MYDFMQLSALQDQVSQLSTQIFVLSLKQDLYMATLKEDTDEIDRLEKLIDQTLERQALNIQNRLDALTRKLDDNDSVQSLLRNHVFGGDRCTDNGL